MARAIDADALLEKLQRMIDYCKNGNQVNGLTALFQVGDAIMDCPTLTPPNEWVSVYDRLPEPGERVLATDCGFVGEFYINKRGKWQRYNVNCSELLMALDILYWMPLPAPPDRCPPEGIQ